MNWLLVRGEASIQLDKCRCNRVSAEQVDGIFRKLQCSWMIMACVWVAIGTGQAHTHFFPVSCENCQLMLPVGLSIFARSMYLVQLLPLSRNEYDAA